MASKRIDKVKNSSYIYNNMHNNFLLNLMWDVILQCHYLKIGRMSYLHHYYEFHVVNAALIYNYI